MIKIKVRGVIVEKGTNKVFLCGDGSFLCLPGGTLEPGETREETLKREFLEEVGIEPVIGKLLYINEFTGEDKTTIDFWYEIENTQEFHNIDLSKVSGTEVIDCGFFNLETIQVEFRPQDLGDILKKIH